MSDEIDYKAEVLKKFSTARINDDYSGAHVPDVGVFRDATKEDWSKNREIAISGFFSDGENSHFIREFSKKVLAEIATLKAKIPPTLPPMDGKGVESQLVALAERMYECWDSDRDSKLGKLLNALCGRSPGYSEDVDKLFAALQQVEQKSDEWRRRYHQIERAHSRGVDRQGELMRIICDREADRSREQDLKNQFRAERDQAQKAPAAEAWIEIKEGCELPQEEEKVCVWNGHHWGEIRPTTGA